jgi:ferredoxin-NADP reductase
MSFVLSSDFVTFAGIAIVAAVLIQVALMLAATMRRVAMERETSRLAQDVLRFQIDAALINFRVKRDTAEFSWNGLRKFTIARKVFEVEGVHSFYLSPHDGKPLPPFLPGQHLTFELKIPGQIKPVIRCYSLSDSPKHPDFYRVTIKKTHPQGDIPDAAPGLSSTFFNDVVREGDIVDVKAPTGHFHLQPQRDIPTVLIAGGIGITPVLSMLNSLCEASHRGEIWFFLGVRNSAEHMMKQHLEELAASHRNLNLHICYSLPSEGDVLGSDYHTEGYVGVDLFKKLLPSNNYTFYICGPPPMMDSIVGGLYDWSVPEDQVHFEAFGQATVRKTKKPEPASADASAEEAIEIAFVRSNKTLQWTETEGSILDLAEANGISMDFACRTGNCGTCVTAIKGGAVDYLVEPGYPIENGSCLACVGVPKGPLKLDA